MFWYVAATEPGAAVSTVASKRTWNTRPGPTTRVPLGSVVPRSQTGPLLSKAIVQDIAASARQIGWLYGLNTLGAGVGAIVAGWVVIGHLGYDGAIYLAAAINVAIAVGGVSLVATRGLSTEGVASDASTATPVADAPVGRWCCAVSWCATPPSRARSTCRASC